MLLRGINLGPTKRISMPALREALTEAGFTGVGTYLQSGNVVLRTQLGAETLARTCEKVISSEFGAEVAVVVRTAAELVEVVDCDPLDGAANDPKRYQVTFLSAEPDPELIERIGSAAIECERLVAIGREIYASHPDGIGRSKLALKIGALKDGTSRNWTTVLALLEMVRA